MTVESSTSRPPRLRVGMVSSVPPTECGLATFSEALVGGLRSHGAAVTYVEAGTPSGADRADVVASLGSGTTDEIDSAIGELEECDVVVVQHEYGIYPGVDGDRVLAFAEALPVPMILVAHTVLNEPTDRQRVVLSTLCRLASAVVVMTETGRRRLQSIYDIDDRSIRVIPHGAAVAPAGQRVPNPRLRMLSWGLLGPGKGIEWAIESLAQVCTDIDVEYVIAGATHPNVLSRDGDEYRRALIAQAHRLGLRDRVVFDDRYRSVVELGELIASADVVVLPYDSKDQVTSGVLVDAVAAGRPVIATSFPHAVELLACGAGIVVPPYNSPAIAGALLEVLGDADRLRQLESAARRVAPSLSWNAVADRYTTLLGAVVARGSQVAS